MASRISRTDLQSWMETGVTIVETLPAPHFATGHLPGAVNIPHARIVELAPPSCSPTRTRRS